MYTHQLLLTPRPPFRLDLTVWILRRIANNQVDRWDGTTYRRALVLHGRAVEVSVTQRGISTCPELDILVRSRQPIQPRDVKTAMSKIFGLSIDLSGFYKMVRTDKQLAELTAPFLGMRPTRFPTLFEAMLNAVACQQVSLQAGLQILNRLSQTYGTQVGDLHTFPTPEGLAGIEPKDIKKVGFSMRKAETISTIARTIVSGTINLESLSRLPDEQILSKLTSFPGIGRWSAEYVLLRGMGRLYSFPGDDIGGAAKLQRWLSLEVRPGYSDVRNLLMRWHPYEGLIYFHLLLRHLQDKGIIRSIETS